MEQLTNVPRDWLPTVYPGEYEVPRAAPLVQTHLAHLNIGLPYVRLVEFDGETKVVCRLRFGRDQCKVVIDSAPADSFDEALQGAISIATTCPREAERDWSKEIRRLYPQKNLSTPKFKNVVRVGVPAYVCTIGNLPGARTVASDPCPTRRLALDDALARLSKAFGRKSASSPPKNSPQPHLGANAHRSSARTRVNDVPQPQSSLSLEEGRRLLKAAIASWGVEHAYWMRQRRLSLEEEQRKHVLSLFIAASEPLRKYEIDPSRRPLIERAIARELAAFQARSAPAAVASATAAALRLLIGRAFADPSHQAHRSQAFDNFAFRRGELPEAVIEDLVARRMLRRSVDGKLTLSTLGCNVLERALTAPPEATTLHARLDASEIAALLDAKMQAAHRRSGA